MVRSRPLALSVVSVLALGVLAACTTSKQEGGKAAPEGAQGAQPTAAKEPPAVAAAVTQADLVKRGGELVRLGGCSDCHTPMAFDPKLGMPVPQMDRFLSGHPAGAPDPTGHPGKGDQAVIGPTFTSFKLPFGVVYAQNLTPDAETGLRMDKAQFIRAMRTGKHRGDESGRPILPPMPWMNLQGAPETDLEAMHAYLLSLAPVKNKVPENKVPPPVLVELAKAYGQMAAAAPSAPAAAPKL